MELHSAIRKAETERPSPHVHFRAHEVSEVVTSICASSSSSSTLARGLRGFSSVPSAHETELVGITDPISAKSPRTMGRRGSAAVPLTRRGSGAIGVRTDRELPQAIKTVDSNDRDRFSTCHEVELEAAMYRRHTLNEKRIMVQNLTQRSVRFTGRRRARAFVFSAGWQVFMSVIALMDMLLAIVQLELLEQPISQDVSNLTIYFVWEFLVTAIYTIDLLMRIKVFRPAKFFQRASCIFEFIVAVLVFLNCVLIAIALFARTDLSACLGAFVYSRLLPVLRMVWLFGRHGRGGGLLRNPCMMGLRSAVSGKRRRFVDLKDNIDLDLTYITPRVIAMSVPMQGVHSMFRNVLSEVSRFFETHHHSRYLIVNCCPELPYPDQAFLTGRVVKFDIQDHSPPTMSQFLTFLSIVWEWMAADPKNVVAVHCKGGKGRTGSLCCAWLLYAEECSDVDDALLTFALARTDIARGAFQLQGVETPSQVRYLHQLYDLLDGEDAFSGRPVPSPTPYTVGFDTLSFHDIFHKAPPKDMIIAIHRCDGNGAYKVVYWSEIFQVNVGVRCADIRLDWTMDAEDVRISVFDHQKLEKARKKFGGLGFLGDDPPVTSACETHSGTATELKRVLAGHEPGCLFYFLFHVGFLDPGLDKFVVRIGNQEAGAFGMDKAWKKKQKYHMDGEVHLLYHFPDDSDDNN